MSNSGGAGSVYRPKYRDKATGALKESAIWWISYTHKGVKYRESSKSAVKQAARALLKQRLGKAGLGQPVAPIVHRTTLDTLANLVITDYQNHGYDTLARQEDAFNHLREFRGGDVPAEAITTQWINDYIRWRRAQADGRSLKRRAGGKFAQGPRIGCADATINRELAALRRAFRLAARNTPPLVASVPHISLLTERNRRTGFFEWAEFSKLREHLPDYLKPVMTVAYYTGWRVPSELLTRQKHHIVNGMLELAAGEAKNEEPRRFPLDVIPELRETIENQCALTRQLEIETGRVIPWLFHNAGNPIVDYRQAWHKACRAAGIAGRIPHDFRRTAARNLINAGVDPMTTMRLVGWEDVNMLRRYNIIDDATLTSGVAKLRAYLDAQKRQPEKVVPIRG
ncbi:tyrosine-type recombinase/integrase [bacterium]|nr:tyrosine-type recombinase/integrase [bacterium]